MKRTLVIGLLCCAAPGLSSAGAGASAPATGSAPGRTIEWAGDQVTRIGALRTSPSRTRPPTVARAVAAFGKPSSRKRTSNVSCLVRWDKIGLRGNFVNLGQAGVGRSACADAVGLLQTATITGKSFRTPRGLHIGDTTTKLKTLHPGATFQDGAWWLATAPAVIGDVQAEQRIWVVRALSQAGVVQRFNVRVGAAGD